MHQAKFKFRNHFPKAKSSVPRLEATLKISSHMSRTQNRIRLSRKIIWNGRRTLTFIWGKSWLGGSLRFPAHWGWNIKPFIWQFCWWINTVMPEMFLRESTKPWEALAFTLQPNMSKSRPRAWRNTWKYQMVRITQINSWQWRAKS